MIDLLSEFDRQAALLPVDRELVGRLRAKIARLASSPVSGNIAMCLVANAKPFPSVEMMARVIAKKKTGVVEMTPRQPSDFAPIEGVRTPASDLYLLWDIDTGRSRLNVSPEDSLAAIYAEGRSPLTLEEGVMVALAHPAIFTDKKRLNCIQMPGSRCPGDQRVPSIWFSKGAPRLGWCWDRNIHTWLGSASVKDRIEP